VTAANRRAEIGKAGRDDSCKIPGSINANLHIHTSDLLQINRSLGSGAWYRARKSMVILLVELAMSGKYMAFRGRRMADS
jgi:hypothetical protein